MPDIPAAPPAASVLRVLLEDDLTILSTFRRGNKAHQDDYLFASEALKERLDECTALPFNRDWPSDHVPIIATFKE